MRRWGSIWVASACVLAIGQGCDRGAIAEAPPGRAENVGTSSGEAELPPTNIDPQSRIAREGVQIGYFELAANPVVDGDTIRIKGVDKSIRLLSIDTEERLEGRADRVAAKKDFDAYLKRKRGDAKRPGKPRTPMGDAAAKFAEEFFRGTTTVRLERDVSNELVGQHGRSLAYVAVNKNGRWTSYNLECVRAGMSPYFTKYGYSRRLNGEFRRAEAEAREAKRGIWAPDAQSYGDYDERKAWWDARADFIQAVEHEGRQRDDYVFLSQSRALEKLEQRLGKTVTVVSTIDRIQHFKGLSRVNLHRAPKQRFPVIFFDRDVFRETDIDEYRGEPVTVRGTIERYEKGDYSTLQIVVEKPEQVTLPSLPDGR